MKKTNKKRRLIIVGVLAALLLLAGTVAVFAQGMEKANEDGPNRNFAPEVQRRIDQMRFQERQNRGRRFMANLDYDALLAEALDITPDELREARREANLAALELAVEEGLISQRKVDLMTAVPVLRGAIDRVELVAGALGISAEELQEARQDQALPELLEELDMTRADVKEATLAAFEAFVQQAVDDELISEEQAELILENPGLILRTQRELQARGRFMGRGEARGLVGPALSRGVHRPFRPMGGS